ncbi:uncharacterized protein LOC131248403 isoform X2 [Magnolia sinica]|uniref:uncharacterized protein LOC131248403 isoform X2 n=1 Tax=Magnolia sinica TaxID=86752 RepID=UPI00265AA959|nr:uncharacterized protein LOC131248403 isoform X2 [Magnolia sinica]
MASAALEEQQEKLRRAVDDWRCRSHDLLKNLLNDPHGSSSAFDDICSSSSDPVRVSAEPLEHSDVSNLVESDNVAVSKFVTVLSYDCFEISRLCRRASRSIYRQLLLFGYRSSSQEILLEGEPQKAFGHSLSLFVELSEISSRMSEVLGNLLQQLHSIYSLQDNNSRPYKSFKNMTLKSAFTSFGDGLAMFLVLDEILMQNGHINTYLSLFTRMLNKMKMEVDNSGISIVDLDCLDQVVSHLEKHLDVGLFRRLLQEGSPWQDTLQKVRCSRKFLDACTSCTHDGLSDILSRLDTWKEFPFDRIKILSYVALVLFGAYASAEAPEKRLGKVILEMLQVVPVIYIKGGIRFMLFDLLKNQFPQSLSSWPALREAAREWDATKSSYLIRLNEMHSRDWQAMKDALACWVASFQSAIHPLTDQSKVEACLRVHMKQIIQGILLANRMQITAISMLDLHALLEVPVKREKLKSLCHMVILLRVVEDTFHKKGLDIIQSLPHIINLMQADIEQLLLPARSELQSEISKGNQATKMRFLSSLTRGGRDTDTRLTDSLSLVLLSLQMLRGGGSSKRQLILSVALDVIQCIGHINIDFSRIKKRMSRLDTIADFQRTVEEVTNCSFLYWRKEMMGTWFSMVYMDVNKFSWLQYLLDAFCDGLWLLKLGNVGTFTIQSHEEEIENAMKNEIIMPLCRDIETDLRLHVHSTNLRGSVHVNPTKTGVRNLSWYLQMKPLRLPFKYIDIKLHVESYLDSAFYNHTAMSPYNWKVYSEMRQLAELKYGLVLDDIHLPPQSLDHGLDVTDIMQNLPKFAECYSYNINNQIFIEKVSIGQSKKSLRIIGVEHFASSVATHGRGIVSAAVSSVLKFLKQKLASLSELLQDNFVKSHLLKEFKFWKGDRGATNKSGMVEAEELNVTIGKLPLADHELSFLEQLRCIITEMGNVLGFVRSLRAGDSRHTGRISRFIYRPGSITSFGEYSQRLGFIDETVMAGRMMDIAIENQHQSDEHTNYFSFLINAFSKSSEYIHLRDFSLLVPALIMSLVDCKIHSKDKKLRGRDVGNQITTDEGFVMGVAYILKVTGQEKSFDGLHWFADASKQFKEALVSIEESRGMEQRKGSGLAGFRLWGHAAAPPISIETQKGIDKLKRYLKEMELIECGFNVSRTIML